MTNREDFLRIAKPHILAAAISIALSVMSQTAVAETDTSASDEEAIENNLALPAMQVEDDYLQTNTEGTKSYTSGAVSLGKGNEAIRDIPQSVSIITNQLIKDKNLLTLNDALQNTTGVTVKSYGSGTANYVIRGFEVNSVSIDGIRTSASGSGTHSHGAPDLAAYERVEVLRGAAGLLQGTGEPGGFINLVRKRALAENKIGFRASANSWPGYRTELDVTGALNETGTVRGRAVAAYEDIDSYVDDLEM